MVEFLTNDIEKNNNAIKLAQEAYDKVKGEKTKKEEMAKAALAAKAKENEFMETENG